MVTTIIATSGWFGISDGRWRVLQKTPMEGADQKLDSEGIEIVVPLLQGVSLPAAILGPPPPVHGTMSVPLIQAHCQPHSAHCQPQRAQGTLPDTQSQTHCQKGNSTQTLTGGSADSAISRTAREGIKVMLSPSTCKRQLALPSGPEGRPQMHRSRRHPPCGLLLIIMLSSWTLTCQGSSLSSDAAREMQMWIEIQNTCTAILSDTQPMVPAIEEFCFMVMGMQQNSQGSEEKDNTKREEIQSPGSVLSRGYFLFRPRNGRRSLSFR
ncbi:neuromedin-U isoform X2 [Pelobates cultripes]|uniref:Neuromedin-U isoform X2 n=1 Tax=Pelobates cultripes TaxID=61616 RepID=A0AAD1SJY5_PELCU|nr:neuromedin-U isoform X2 [Pelobates cultripes]